MSVVEDNVTFIRLLARYWMNTNLLAHVIDDSSLCLGKLKELEEEV
jgi:hypothetical protein